ncbi:hypothetical protein OP853_004662 [Salmonella enterica]|nr:hypothetical protein [Salmonella enterica]
MEWASCNTKAECEILPDSERLDNTVPVVCTDESFCEEAERRANNLMASLVTEDVKLWCQLPENSLRLIDFFDECQCFITPGTQKMNEVQRRDLWKNLMGEHAAVLKQITGLMGRYGKVLARQGVKGERFAGAVLYCVLKEWCQLYYRYPE